MDTHLKSSEMGYGATGTDDRNSDSSLVELKKESTSSVKSLFVTAAASFAVLLLLATFRNTPTTTTTIQIDEDQAEQAYEEQTDLQDTPFGPFPNDCVHILREDGMIRAHDKGVDVVSKVTGEVLESHAKLEKCLPYQQNVIDSRMQKKASIMKKRAGETLDASEPTTDTELNGWLDYVGYWPEDKIVFFNGTYTVPEDPLSSMDQVLFYFIGLENIEEDSSSSTTKTTADDDDDIESTITILQPVLTWGNTETGWSMASWNCCPTGQTWVSSSITDLSAGQTLTGSIDVGDEHSTVISSLDGGVSVELRVDTGERTFDWMDVTLEAYYLSECDQFPSSPMNITNMMSKSRNQRTETTSDLKMNWIDDSTSSACSGQMHFTETTWSSDHHA
uniref:Uncharacterized protein n=1 Tax=Octactis speculum TaxID=3111310 RepID=A0A6U3SZ20_9STRA|mmetsp:Transcript_3242/g.3697  ORF Transcript_3242/g.3697 Transcript_3242/m.3697 type:complete len:391 (+) Transcript_3242:87-1259(+)|eukprot:CAMPEP_0185769006 /NCGR_PEP_ID=MMETSP1174-20130828/53311_1 /TAXON_ID=35687 /ORGANISM="Dictyocha speculum, Strain CCMP1381" /LENGTH=390 /DNA_ID=CAMNT_0028453937 /DNA_START=77 /DNA_END=1249 /DNA_ORIENTATION=-